MNKSTFIKLFMALVAVLFFANCGDDDSSGPTLSVSPTSVTLDESNSATLTVSSNTSWNVASSDSWLNCSPSGATGGAQVTVSANSLNNTGSARTATLKFTDKTGTKVVTVSVTQLPVKNNADDPDKPDEPMPTLTVSKSSIQFGADGGNETVSIESNTSWTVASSESWCAVSPSSGTNNGTVTVSATANTETSQRTATITVKTATGEITQTIAISQKEAEKLTVSKSTIQFGADGGNETFTIESNTSWTVASSESWCTVSPSSGTNNGTVTVTAAANTVTSQRTATITVKTAKGEIEKTISVSQQAKEEDVSATPFEEPYLGWGTSQSTVGAILKDKGHNPGSYTSESESIYSYSNNMERMTVYRFTKTRLSYAEVWMDVSKYSMSKTRNYLSSTLNYISTGTSTSGSTTYYNYLSKDGLTKASVREFKTSSDTYAIVKFESSGTGILFEEPFMIWGTSMYTAKTAIESMGYTVKVDGTNLKTDTSKPKYEEWFISYWFGTSNQLYHINVYFDDDKYTKNDLRNYLTNTLKYKYQKEEGYYTYYLLPDGKTQCDIYSDTSSLWVSFYPVKSSAPSMARRIEREKSIETKIRQERMQRNR